MNETLVIIYHVYFPRDTCKASLGQPKCYLVAYREVSTAILDKWYLVDYTEVSSAILDNLKYSSWLPFAWNPLTFYVSSASPLRVSSVACNT